MHTEQNTQATKISDAKILHLKPQTEKQRRFLFLELQEA